MWAHPAAIKAAISIGPMPWTLTIRTGGRVQRERFDDLPAALDALDVRAQQLSAQPARRPVNAKVTRFESGEQVAARLELAGPQRLLAEVHAGLDLRGDGSAEAYRGRVRRTTVAREPGEDVVGALRRALTGPT